MKKILIIVLCPFISIYANSLSLKITEEFLFSSESNEMPHYLMANRWGLVQKEDFQSLTYIDLNKRFNFKNNLSLELGGLVGFSLGDEPDYILNELYAQLDFYSLQMFIGKKHHTQGNTPENLSSGSMTVSSNASPIPKISIGFNDFVTVPYTFDLLQLKGNYSHGWFQGDRYVDEILLHEKSFFVRLNSTVGLYPYGGLVHEAMWYGIPNEGEYEGEEVNNLDLTNYIVILRARAGNEDAIIEGERINKAGDHIGAWEYGLYGYYNIVNFQLYYQHLFEDGSGMEYQNEYDGLWGINIEPKTIDFINDISFEFLTTKFQSGDAHDKDGEILGGRDSYYDHYVYRNGWTHLNQVLGNSFFSTIGEDSTLRVANNRMDVFQLGFDGGYKNILYKLQGAYGEYYPAYASVSLFNKKEYMWHLYSELTFKDAFIDRLDIKAGIAYDFGSLKDLFGCGLSLSWEM